MAERFEDYLTVEIEMDTPRRPVRSVGLARSTNTQIVVFAAVALEYGGYYAYFEQNPIRFARRSGKRIGSALTVGSTTYPMRLADPAAVERAIG